MLEPQPSNWPKVFFRASKGAVFLVGLLYAIGLIIVNIDLAAHGVVVLELVRTEYLLAGALWVVLNALGLGLYRAVPFAMKEHWSSPRGLLSRLWLAIGEVLAAWALASWMLALLSGNVLSLWNGTPGRWDQFVISIQVGFQLLLALFLSISMLRGFIRRGPAGLVHPAASWATASLLASLLIYSLTVYPWLAKAFGGGQKPTVQVVLDVGTTIPWQANGIESSPDTKHIGPATLVLETDRRLYLSRPITLTKGYVAPQLVYGQPVGVDQDHVLALVFLPRTPVPPTTPSPK